MERSQQLRQDLVHAHRLWEAVQVAAECGEELALLHLVLDLDLLEEQHRVYEVVLEVAADFATPEIVIIYVIRFLTFNK